MRLLSCTMALALALTAFGAEDATWPQLHGPRRDNISRATGLLKKWPEGGPPLIWKATGIGFGYASVSIVRGKLYTAGDLEGKTVISALDLDGKLLWQGENGAACSTRPTGARATPTYDNGKLYHLNGNGRLACLDAADGKDVWAVDIVKEFEGRKIRWAFAEAPLINGPRVLCTPGGAKGLMVALDKLTGKTVWACTELDDKAGYTAAVLIQHAGVRQAVTITANYAIGVAPETGKLLWKYEHKVPYEANCISPFYHDGHIALAGTWGRGATLLKLHAKDGACTVEEVWRTKDLDTEHGGFIVHEGYIYGQSDGKHERRHWTCLDWDTGKTMWDAEGLTGRTGATSYADGMLYMMNDSRTVALAPANPMELEMVSQFMLPEAKGPTWAHLVIFGGRLYIRHNSVLYAYDIRAK